MVTSPLRLFLVASVDDLIHELAIGGHIDLFENVGTRLLKFHNFYCLTQQDLLDLHMLSDLFELLHEIRTNRPVR